MTILAVLAALLDLAVIGGLLIGLGWWLAGTHLQAEQQTVQAERSALDAEWHALEQTRRVRETFLQARRAMRAEANHRAGGDLR